ncbi:hypothetical protein FA15DRAFT_657073 [Coprinopsis marcescibilis]|uniref:Uncharacterized protein n=1 Tax=Coprinopsis marcescibilis TaxID=230819 RepID=A0A5C3KQV2_COPMA|nr:hypothetical protein FA15DRAFT_657073 [Coprinopsis marcescibilis]
MELDALTTVPLAGQKRRYDETYDKTPEYMELMGSELVTDEPWKDVKRLKPAAGRYLLTSADIGRQCIQGLSVEFGIPSLPEDIEMTSEADNNAIQVQTQHPVLEYDQVPLNHTFRTPSEEDTGELPDLSVLCRSSPVPDGKMEEMDENDYLDIIPANRAVVENLSTFEDLPDFSVPSRISPGPDDKVEDVEGQQDVVHANQGYTQQDELSGGELPDLSDFGRSAPEMDKEMEDSDNQLDIVSCPQGVVDDFPAFGESFHPGDLYTTPEESPDESPDFSVSPVPDDPLEDFEDQQDVILANQQDAQCYVDSSPEELPDILPFSRSHLGQDERLQDVEDQPDIVCGTQGFINNFSDFDNQTEDTKDKQDIVSRNQAFIDHLSTFEAPAAVDDLFDDFQLSFGSLHGKSKNKEVEMDVIPALPFVMMEGSDQTIAECVYRDEDSNDMDGGDEMDADIITPSQSVIEGDSDSLPLLQAQDPFEDPILTSGEHKEEVDTITSHPATVEDGCNHTGFEGWVNSFNEQPENSIFGRKDKGNVIPVTNLQVVDDDFSMLGNDNDKDADSFSALNSLAIDDRMDEQFCSMFYNANNADTDNDDIISAPNPLAVDDSMDEQFVSVFNDDDDDDSNDDIVSAPNPLAVDDSMDEQFVSVFDDNDNIVSALNHLAVDSMHEQFVSMFDNNDDGNDIISATNPLVVDDRMDEQFFSVFNDNYNDNDIVSAPNPLAVDDSMDEQFVSVFDNNDDDNDDNDIVSAPNHLVVDDSMHEQFVSMFNDNDDGDNIVSAPNPLAVDDSMDEQFFSVFDDDNNNNIVSAPNPLAVEDDDNQLPDLSVFAELTDPDDDVVSVCPTIVQEEGKDELPDFSVFEECTEYGNLVFVSSATVQEVESEEEHPDLSIFDNDDGDNDDGDQIPALRRTIDGDEPDELPDFSLLDDQGFRIGLQKSNTFEQNANPDALAISNALNMGCMCLHISSIFCLGSFVRSKDGKKGNSQASGFGKGNKKDFMRKAREARLILISCNIRSKRKYDVHITSAPQADVTCYCLTLWPEHGPNIERFQLALYAKSTRLTLQQQCDATMWNQAAGTILADYLIKGQREEGDWGWQMADKPDLCKAFMQHTIHLKTVYNNYVNSRPEEEANKHHEQYLNTCKRATHPKLQKFQTLLQDYILFDALSGDESEEDGTFTITHLPWHSWKLRDWFQLIDDINIVQHHPDGQRKTGGALSAIRRDPEQMNPPRRIPEGFHRFVIKGLPQDFYDEEFLAGYESGDDVQKKALEPFDFTIPHELRRYRTQAQFH